MSILNVQAPTLYLAGAGTIVGATSVTLTTFSDIYGNVLTMADFGTKGFCTVEPDTSNSESFTFSGVSSNANGTYTLTGVKTSLAKSAYTETSGLIRGHSGGSKVVVTDSAAFWATFANKNNDETITGNWTVPTGGTGQQIANADDIANAVTAVSGTATNTVFGTVKLSVASVSGPDPIAVGDNDTRVPTASQALALPGTSGTPSGTNKYVTNDDTGTSGAGKVLRLDGSGKIPALDGSQITGLFLATDIQTFNTPGANTWTKPTNAKLVLVEAWGGGGGSGGVSSGKASGGGGGGGYFYRWIPASLLGTSETATVGDGGAAGVSGSSQAGSGGNSTFGSWLTSVGGAGSLGDAGGTGTPVGGVGGGTGTIWAGGAANTSADYGGAGGQAGDSNGAGSLGAACSSVYGGGGGAGGSLIGTAGTGTAGTFEGGAGGDGGTNAIGSVGVQPGGGAGGSAGSGTARVGAKGGAGRIRVTTFF